MQNLKNLNFVNFGVLAAFIVFFSLQHETLLQLVL